MKTYASSMVLCLVLLAPPTRTVCAQAEEAHPPASDRWSELVERPIWLFLGDSNTYAGEYIALLEARLAAQRAQDASSPLPQLLNLGVPSETASGLSEVDHPFKRPCVHERLDKVLTMIEPGVVFICYGMNDGIYQPPSAENLASYQSGMLRLVEQLRARTDAIIICLTPPIFEPEPVAARGGLGPSSAGRYAYFAPAGNYDDTVREQAEWCLLNEMQADEVIDIHRLLAEAKRERLKSDTQFCFSNDGIHYGTEAHQLVAQHLAQSLGAPRELLELELNENEIERSKRRMQLLRDAYLSATGKNRPGLPAGYPIWYVEQMLDRSLDKP